MSTLRIQGMTCQHCAATVQKILEELGATMVRIDVAQGEAWFEGMINGEVLRRAIAAKGFEVID